MPAQFPSAPRSMPRRPQVGRQTGMAAPAPGTAPNPAFHPPQNPAWHPTGWGGSGGVGNLGPFPSSGTQQPGIGNLGTSPGIQPGQTTVNPISTPFYGTQRGADTQFGVDRMRQAIGRDPVGFAPEVLAKMQADADRRIGFGVDSQLQTAGRFGGAQGALLSQLATAGGATDRAGVGADITRMQQDRLRDDTRYADAMGQSLAQFGQAERGLESGEAGRRTSLEADTARFNASQDFSNQQANANRDLQGQGMNLDANQFDRQFQRSGEQQQFQNILQLLNSGQISDGQYRQMIQDLLRQQGGGIGNLPGGVGGRGGAITLGRYAGGTGNGTHPGGPAIVGEEGPEIALLPPGTSVIPHKPSMAMMGMPGYAGGTQNVQGPGMFRNLLSRQVNPVGIQSSSPENAAVWAAMANMNPGLGITPTGGDPLAAQEYNDTHLFMSKGPPMQGAGSSGILDREYADAMGDFQQGQRDAQMNAAINARGRDNNSWTSEELAADRGQNAMPMPRPRQPRGYAGMSPGQRNGMREVLGGQMIPGLFGYAKGTPDWQDTMTGPLPPVTAPPSLWGGPDTAEFTMGDNWNGGEVPSGGGVMTIGGRSMSVFDPESARLAESRGALRNKITGGGLTDADLPALMGEYARTSIGDNQPDDLISGGLRGLAIQQQFENADAMNQYRRMGGRTGSPLLDGLEGISAATARLMANSDDPQQQQIGQARLKQIAEKGGVSAPGGDSGKAASAPSLLQNIGSYVKEAVSEPGAFFGGLADTYFGGSSANASPPKQPTRPIMSSGPFGVLSPTPTPTPGPGGGNDVGRMVSEAYNAGALEPGEYGLFVRNQSDPGFLQKVQAGLGRGLQLKDVLARLDVLQSQMAGR